MINGHGDDIYSYGTKIVSNFSSNIYTATDMAALDAYLCSHISAIHSYPEPDGASLAQQLATHHKINADNICLTNGATEAIYLIAQAFRGKQASILIPTFSEYADACLANEMQVQYTNRLEDISTASNLIWICNPNNPTGKVIDKETLIEFISEHSQATIVIDQSYGYFTREKVFSVEESLQYDNLILLHSLTKKYAIPGLRLGYFTANESLADKVKRFRMPWSVNQMAIEAGHFLLNNSDIFSPDIDTYLTEKERFASELKTIGGLTVDDSDTHFFVCRLSRQSAAELKKHLIENHGILIRNADNFKGLNQSCFRLATQTKEENDRLINILRKWIL